MPNATAYFLRDVISLTDGRLAAFRFAKNGPQDVSIVTIRPGDARWSSVAVDSPFDDSTIYDWAQGPDGRIYSHSLVIDPTGERWTVEPWGNDAPATLTIAIAAGDDGRIYVRDEQHMPRLHVFDTTTGAWTTSAENTVICCVDALLAGGDMIYALETEGIASYDPATDTWAELTRMPYHNAARAGMAPDGRIVLLDAWAAENQRIDAFDPTSREWSELPRPHDAAPRWNPTFVTGPDGRLWAVDGGQAFVSIGD